MMPISLVACIWSSLEAHQYYTFQNNAKICSCNIPPLGNYKVSPLWKFFHMLPIPEYACAFHHNILPSRLIEVTPLVGRMPVGDVEQYWHWHEHQPLAVTSAYTKGDLGKERPVKKLAN